MPADINASDAVVAEREWEMFLDAIVANVCQGAFCVNPFYEGRRAKNKPLQLRAAAAAGLTIPETLVSSDPLEVRKFFARHDGKIIFKPFNFTTWKAGKNSYSSFTTSVSREQIDWDDAILLCPGLYQSHVHKQYEVRITFMGHEYIGAQIMSQEFGESSVDWRAGRASQEIRNEPISVPPHIAKCCIRLMQSLGIVFGAFDFIIQPNGDYVFLEVNEMGQFLWFEEENSHFALLDTFVKFLISRRPDFRRETNQIDFRFQDFKKSQDYADIVSGTAQLGHTKIKHQGLVMD